MTEFEISERFGVEPARLYSAWLSSEEHTEMTGGGAVIDPTVGGEFSAWDEYIWGTTTELERDRRIVQAWRTAEFASGDEDSRLELEFRAAGDDTLLVLRHTKIPDGQPDYKQGWVDNYFEPMHRYFGA